MTDIIIPADEKQSRIKTRPVPNADVDPDDITTVDAKVTEFWGLYEDGAIDSSDIEQIAPDAWRVTARVWKQAHSQGRPDSTASSTRAAEYDEHPSGAHPLETAQSIAIGRALRFMGITGHQGGQTDGKA